MPRLSIVIPTYNRLERLQRVLSALEAQTIEPTTFQVVVVSDGSSDGTAEFLQSASYRYALKPIMQANQGVAVARNNGVAATESELVLFIDDDVIPQPQLVAEHLGCHDTYGANTVVLGPMLSPPDYEMSPWVAWEQAMLVKQYDAMVQGVYEPTSRQFYTGNTSLRREHVVRAGGFDPDFRRAEDIELAFRLDGFGLKFVFNPQAVGHHYAERSFQSWIAIPYAYGQNDVIFTRERGQSWLLPTVFREYHNRNLLIRALTRLCLDRPVLSNVAMSTLKQSALLFHNIGIDIASRRACSGLWNLRQYQGVTDQIGGRRVFFNGIARARKALVNQEPSPPPDAAPQKEPHG